MSTSAVDDECLARWCEQWLGARPVETLFTGGHLAVVVGVRLSDDREVVVKIRPAAQRVGACTEVQRHLWASGYPCPRPLAGPEPLGAKTATAEEYVSGGMQLPRDGAAPRRFARLLWQLIDRCAQLPMKDRLRPPPSWVAWDHGERGVWPIADDSDVDLNADAEPRWLDDVAGRARALLLRYEAHAVVGHADWESQNIRWRDERPLVVHDWDSAASRPEATIAGAASAIFTINSDTSAATLAETELFLDAYQEARGRSFGREDLGAAWAAGLWVRAYDAKIVRMHRNSETEAFADEAWERLRRATA